MTYRYGTLSQAAAALYDGQVECRELAKSIDYPLIDDGSLIGAR